MIRRNSAATPSSTARFSFVRLEWFYTSLQKS